MEKFSRLRRNGVRSLAMFFTIVALGLGVQGVASAETTELPEQGIVGGTTNGDYVHISNTPPASASAHGWWTYDKKTDLRADVTVQLQVNREGTWTNVGVPGVERVRPGGGSVNRSNARVQCLTFESTEWRSVIDVDIIGVIDSPEVLVTMTRRLNCGV